MNAARGARPGAPVSPWRSHRLNSARELDEEAITHGLEQPSSVLGDLVSIDLRARCVELSQFRPRRLRR
jgi:hypothetical protein